MNRPHISPVVEPPLSCSPLEQGGKRRRHHHPCLEVTTASSSSSATSSASDDKTETLTTSSTILSTSSADDSDYEWRDHQPHVTTRTRNAFHDSIASPWTASRSSTSRLCHILGYLAGLAGGEISLFAHIQPASTTTTKVVLAALLNRLVRILLNASFMLLSLGLSVLLLPLALVDVVRCQVFWARSLNAAYDSYQARVRKRRASLQGLTTEALAAAAFDCDAARWQRRPWKCSYAWKECAFVFFFSLLHITKQRSLRGLRSELKRFRQHLTLYPPAFPVRSNDEVFRFDKPRARFNLSMLFVIDRLKFSDICDGFRDRLIFWEPKMSSTVSTKWGRSCFTPCPDFRVENHIRERGLDLRSGETVAAIMSEFGSAELDATKPLWQVLVLQAQEAQPSLTRTAEMEEANFLPPDREPHQVSYILAKWSHVYADGVGTMTTIVKRLGDYGVDMSGLPEKYRQQVPGWQVFLFWCWHGLLAIFQGLRLFLFMSYGLAPYPGLIQTTSKLRFPFPHTGRKWYSTPASFKLDEINHLRDVIAKQTRVRPTVNDIFSHCVAASAGRLRSILEVETYLRHYLKLPGQIMSSRSPHKGSQVGSLRHHCLQSIIPMMCRTSVPMQMDNFTSLVSSRLPLPEHCWTAKKLAEGGMIQELLRVKSEIDFLKGQRLRTTSFLIMTFLFKSLPLPWARTLYECAYRSMQLCSTNVAAPGIESKFFGKEVHGLYFWPAVPATGTLGTSLVSLGNRLQFLTIIEECELLPGVDLAERLYAYEGLHFGKQERQEALRVLSECWRRMVTEEYTKLKSLLLHPDKE